MQDAVSTSPGSKCFERQYFCLICLAQDFERLLYFGQFPKKTAGCEGLDFFLRFFVFSKQMCALHWRVVSSRGMDAITQKHLDLRRSQELNKVVIRTTKLQFEVLTGLTLDVGLVFRSGGPKSSMG